MIDKKGEKSIDMAIGALSVSSELNDKNNTPIIAKGQFDVLSMDANLGIRDECFEVLFDFSKGIVLDIALIFGGRIEVNWEKTDGQEN